MHNTNELTTNQALQAIMFANELLAAREEALLTPKRNCHLVVCQCQPKCPGPSKPEPRKQSPALARALDRAISIRG